MRGGVTIVRMAKRKRTSSRAVCDTTVADNAAGATATAAAAEAAPPPTPPTPTLLSSHNNTNPLTVTRKTGEAGRSHEDIKKQQRNEDNSDARIGYSGGENADDEGKSEGNEKRKRKRTRTRKKKPQSSDNDNKSSGNGGGVEVGENFVVEPDEGGGGEGCIAGVTDTIYVEGIPWTCDEDDVREFFKACGKITDVRMPRWQDSGRPRGYAHVSFAGAKAARMAFGLDGQYLKGRYLTVQAPQEPATEKERRANRMAEQPRGCRTVFVKNLPYDADDDGVSEALSGCGRIASVRLAMWNHTRKLKGFGYVEFATERGAETCVRTQEKLAVGGRPVVIDFETGAPKGSFRRQDGAQIKKTSADAGVGKGKAPKFKVHVK